MGLIGCLVVSKLLESWWLLFVNMRQYGEVNRVTHIPPAIGNVYSESHLRDARDKANRRIISDLITIALNALIYTIAITYQNVRTAWECCESASTGDELLAYVMFAGGCATLHWLCCLPASFIRTFIIGRTALTLEELQTWIGDGAQHLIDEAGDMVPSAVAIYAVPRLTDKPALTLAGLSIIHHAVLYLYLRYSAEPHESVFWSMPNSKLKLRLAVIASLLGFSPQHVFKVDNWCEGDEWHPYIEGEPGHRGIAGSLVMTFYREEAGGGHAKSFDVPEIMAYAAHGLSFCKNMFPLSMAGYSALRTVVNILIACKMVLSEHLFYPFGFREKPPLVVALFISYFILLAPLNKLWRLLELWGSRRFYNIGDRLVASLGLGRQLARALIKAEAEAGVTPAADRLYSYFYATRPPLIDRLEHLGVLYVDT